MGLLTANFGRTSLIVVVDERTRRGAVNAIEQAFADGNYNRAHAGLTAMCKWLKQEIRTGRKSKRLERVAFLEQAEMQLAEARQFLGLA